MMQLWPKVTEDTHLSTSGPKPLLKGFLGLPNSLLTTSAIALNTVMTDFGWSFPGIIAYHVFCIQFGMWAHQSCGSIHMSRLGTSSSVQYLQ
mmetsp:Transcript_9868/g.13528  ORF Transcript_9868/g.13528 Transcript_9868/m.13528 type:complete len:92 (-) Transcript_9868:668-943(-)